MKPASVALHAMLNALEGADVNLALRTDLSGRQSGAVFSRCADYRYLLWRIWDPSRPLWAFGMLNPSTADHEVVDPTIARCIKRAEAGGAGGLIVWNLFAYRATKPEDMKAAEDPVGPYNDQAIQIAVKQAALNIAAWGAHGSHKNRQSEVLSALSKISVRLNALEFTAEGAPRHPLYLRLSVQPQPWIYSE